MANRIITLPITITENWEEVLDRIGPIHMGTAQFIIRFFSLYGNPEPDTEELRKLIDQWTGIGQFITQRHSYSNRFSLLDNELEIKRVHYHHTNTLFAQMRILTTAFKVYYIDYRDLLNELLEIEQDTTKSSEEKFTDQKALLQKPFIRTDEPQLQKH